MKFRFAYVDFKHVGSATMALQTGSETPFFLQGRKLKLEYASEEATKKGQTFSRLLNSNENAKENAKTDSSPVSKNDHQENNSNALNRKRMNRNNSEGNDRVKRRNPGEGKAPPTGDPRKTGAAVPFAGTKITFEVE